MIENTSTNKRYNLQNSTPTITLMSGHTKLIV